MLTLNYPSNSNITSLQKWEEGKDFNIIYAIEHTKHDMEIEEINYSNVIRETFKDLEQTIKFLNIYQQQGYQNISICYTVYNKEGKHIIEDYVNELDITFNTKIQNDTNKRNKQLNKVVSELEKEHEMFQAFLERYKSTDLYESFKKEQLQNNKDTNNLYWYEYRLRGFSIGCQPKGFISHDDNKGRHGIISYDRQLSENELSNYELVPYKVVS